MEEAALKLEETPEAGQLRAPKLKTLHVVGAVVAAVLAVAAMVLAGNLISAKNKSEGVHARYSECASAASELMVASDYLTTECRMFVLTGDRAYMDSYFQELLETKRRDAAVETLGAESGVEDASAKLMAALAESNELATVEFHAMRLVCEANGISPMPEPVRLVELSGDEETLSPAEKRARAKSLVLGADYQVMKERISSDVDACATELVKDLEQNVFSLERVIDSLLVALLVITILLMGLVLFVVVTNYALVTRPMRTHEADLRASRPLTITGCYEVRRVSTAYNELFEKVSERTALLRHKAETDALTGALNRGAYDKVLEEQEGDFALVLIDVDHFKEVNDRYGHEVGDEALKRVAGIVSANFRNSDYVCRIGGDEFAAILPKATSSNRDAIGAKLASIAKAVAEEAEGLPRITVSFGVAFRDASAKGNLYHDADRALYESKHAGRNRFTFFGEQGKES